VGRVLGGSGSRAVVVGGSSRSDAGGVFTEGNMKNRGAIEDTWALP